MTFSPAQTKQLLAPIKPTRVLKDGKNNSHVSQQDVTAHLIRVFGFGNHLVEVLNCELISEECRNPEEVAYNRRKWDVVYKATVRVTVLRDHDASMTYQPVDHRRICSFEDASCGDAQNQVRHDAHDLAMKSAISLAKKRACINLGDQFGLSLYNKGQMTALVGGTHVLPEQPEGDTKDLQEDVPQQVALGTDETVHSDMPVEATEEQKAMLAKSLGATEVKEEASA